MATAKKKQNEEVKLLTKLNRLTSSLAKSEAGSVSISVGNVREIIRVLAKAHAEHYYTGGHSSDSPVQTVLDYSNSMVEKWAADEVKRAKKATQPKEPVQAQKKKAKAVSKKKTSK